MKMGLCMDKIDGDLCGEMLGLRSVMERLQGRSRRPGGVAKVKTRTSALHVYDEILMSIGRLFIKRESL